MKKTRNWGMVFALGSPLVVVWVVSMAISYATLIDVADVNGLPLPQLFPILIDVGTVSTMVTAGYLKTKGIRGRWLAYSTFVVLSLVSIMANASHAMRAADLAATTWWAAAILAAVPPALLLAITHLVMLLIPDERERARLQAQREKAQAAAEQKAAPVAPTAPAGKVVTAAADAPTSTVAKPAAKGKTVSGDGQVLRLVAKASAEVDRDEVAEMVQEYLATEGKKPTGALVGEWLGGKSAKTGQRFLKELENESAESEPLVAEGLR